MNTLFKSLTLASLVVASPSFAEDVSQLCIDGRDSIEANEGADLGTYDLCSRSLSYGARLINGRLEVHRRGKRGGRCGKGREIGPGAKTIDVTSKSVNFLNNKGKVVKRIAIPKSGQGPSVYVIMQNDANFVVYDNKDNPVWASDTMPKDCP